MIPASRGEGLPTKSCYRPAGSGTADSSVAGSSVTGSSITGSGAESSSDGTPPLCQPLPSSRSQPATPYQQAIQPPSKSMWLGVTFDSTDKHAATGGQDATPHGRPSTHGWDDKSQPASLTRGVGERSSVQMTSKQMPHQRSEHPSGAPCNAPPASTPGTLDQERPPVPEDPAGAG